MFSGSIPNLINGVSRQVDAMRLPTHLQEQINRFSAPATGNQRRPGTDHVSQAWGSFSGDHFYHSISRDAVERYHVLIGNGDLFVFGADGSTKTVAFPDGKSYLFTPGKPSETFAAASSADYTFIVNKNTRAWFTPEVEPVRSSEALVFVRSGNYDKSYRIWINGTLAAHYRTGDGVDPSNDPSGTSTEEARNEARNVAPAKIAQGLMFGSSTGTINGHTNTDGDGTLSAGDAAALVRMASVLPSAEWEIRRYNNVIHIIRRDNAPFTVRVESDVVGDNQSLIAIRNSVQSFSDLPNHCPEGYVVRVDSLPSSEDEDYWVKATKDGGNDDNGTVVWKECVKPGVALAWDTATLPHILVRESNGTFTFRRAPWVRRKCGDFGETPSFFDSTINDVVFNRGRLAFLTNESVVMTRPGEFFDFWRTTMTAVLDDDPVDVSGTSDNVAIFRHAVSFNEDLYLFANLSVHRLASGDLLTPKTVALPPATTGSINVSVPPVSTSKSILFLSTSLTYGDVREIFITNDTNETDNASVSDHVPNYIPANINRVIASDSVNMAVASTPTPGGSVYVYQYYWAGLEKLQAAWHRWQFDPSAEILGSVFWDDVLHLVIRRGTSLFIEKMSCGSNLFDPGQEWMIHLDRRSYSIYMAPPVVSGNLRTYTLPYNSADAVCCYWGGGRHGLTVRVTSRSGNSITVDSGGSDVVFGVPFVSYMLLSRFYMRQSDGQRETIRQTAPFRLHRLYIHLSNTAYTRACVQPYTEGPVKAKEYSPAILNDAAAKLDVVNLGSGAFSVPIKARSDRAKIWLENSSPYPDVITGVEWEGTYDPRARGL